MSSFDTDFASCADPGQFERFGRAVEFRPDGGTARSVVMIFCETAEEQKREEYVAEDREEVWVEVHRDESHADGGIANPGIGDVLIHPDEPVDTTPFAYQGKKRTVTPDTWELLFARPVWQGRGIVD